MRMAILELLALILLTSCGSKNEILDSPDSELLLFQFDGQLVRIKICGVGLISERVHTKSNADGFSMSRPFAKEGRCQLEVRIGDDFRYDVEIEEDTRFIFVTYNRNEEYVDFLDKCLDCSEYSIEQYKIFPPLD